MSDVEREFHETWLGMVQPIDGLVVSVPVLVEAQCMQRQPPATQQRLVELCPPISKKDTTREIRDLGQFLTEILGLTPDLWDSGDAIPDDLSLYVPEGRQTIRPSLALRKMETTSEPAASPLPDDSTPASRAGARYVMLLWDLPPGLPLDKPERATGPWDYPPSAKFDRLLRHCHVPIGLLTNRRSLRLMYAPHGESTGSITFNIDDMATTGGRPILDAFVMLLSATRFFSVAPRHQLPTLLAESRKRQANVTNELAAQVFEAMEALLKGFEAAAERDGRTLLDDALRREDDHLYGGLLTVLLRLVFLLYAEDRDLVPVENNFYSKNLSVLALFDQLQQDHGAFPDSMSRRFGAWGRLLALFRSVYLGVDHGELHMPQRRGQLFDPHAYPFLEGWGPAGGAPIHQAEERAEVPVPSIDDGTVFRVLEKLVLFQGQRLSYRTLDVEQIGSVYEALMGYHIVRVMSPAVSLGPNGFWVEVGEALEQTKAQRAKWLKENTGLTKAHAEKLASQLNLAKSEAEALDILDDYRVKATERAAPGRLVIQPGAERQRTSSHYTPRRLSAPIVRRTLEPLLAAMGPEPSSEAILSLTVCDPAMGSGAFLVEACRFLADQLIAAWTREGKLELIVSANEDVVNHARRLVAQRCLYGVDQNLFAVNLAKLSLWLVTLARDLPFTFLDHALRHGDSLVGLDFEQVKSFHWKPGKQLALCRKELEAALEDAIASRQKILELAGDQSLGAQREKEWLLRDAEDAVDRVRLIGDLVIGAFFSATKDKDREKERTRRLALVTSWLHDGGPAPDELRARKQEIRERIPVFHWMLEFPEVFYTGKPDPLASDNAAHCAFIDAFIGNPPFKGGRNVSGALGDEYKEWLQTVHEGSHGNADLVAHFFRHADVLVGDHGTIGLLATNTIAQGDTRTTGLQWLVNHGQVIYDATRSMLWPGEAAVAVSIVHLAKGNPARLNLERRLDDVRVADINSRLRAKPERPDPARLKANEGLSFQGSIVVGMGFTLTPEERESLIAREPCNAERIFPYLGGEEVNSSPTQGFDRYVINFSNMSLAEAERWTDLIRIVREKVKPERDRVKRAAHRKYWWHYGDKRPALYKAIAPLPRCLVTSRVTKHLCFSFQPVDRVFAESMYVFPLSAFSAFAVLQSRIHEPWARLLSSSMRDDLRYAASDCFEPFPFPGPGPSAVIPELEDTGQKLHETRARFMLDTQQGLTQTYNLLRDPNCHDPRIEELRLLHEDVDRAVLAAYGWFDIQIPHYVTPTTAAGRKALEVFEDELIDRLFVLNAERAEEERIKGVVTPPSKPAARKSRKRGASSADQLTLLESKAR